MQALAKHHRSNRVKPASAISTPIFGRWGKRMKNPPARCIGLVSIVLFAAAAYSVGASPVDFGRAELARALQERGLSPVQITVSIRAGTPESWSLTPKGVVAADERGAMYALLEAAEQIRREGRLAPASGRPATPMRGVRVFLHNKDQEADWYFSHEYWDAYFSMLARTRFNRFNLVFAHQTNYLAPPYPYLVKLAEFPQVLVRGLSDAERDRNLETLCYVARSAANHGVDFTLGIWQQNVQVNQLPTVEGITSENIGPYAAAALTKVLHACPDIRSVQVRTNAESGIPETEQLTFYRDHFFPAVRDAGRVLDLRTWLQSEAMMDAARQVGVATRVSTKYWAEHIGRPYQPPETFALFGYQALLAKPRRYDLFWEIWGLGSHRILLWGSPDFARRIVSTLTLSNTLGFEVDAPPTQKGYGNRPGRWDVFNDAQSARKFWHWDFERYWFFYLLWGRLSYNPATPDAVWMHEMQVRFGAAAPDVFEAYRQSSRVLHEIVAVHLADPNMYIWPEINPGGLIDSYKEVLPSDWRYIASIPEAVQNLRSGTPSAKQTALETAAFFDEVASRIDAAVSRANATLGAGNREWNGSAPDFQVLASLARYHAHKQRAALNLEWFDLTGNANALAAAKSSLTAGLDEWERLVKFTDGLYSSNFANGPDDVGDWKDKLPYVRHDLELIREREEILQRFGRFDFAYDFGSPPPPPSTLPPFLATPYIRTNNVEPRFTAVSTDTVFDEKTGYGWVPGRWRRSTDVAGLALAPYQEIRATARVPYNLPHDVLFRDYIRTDGAHDFVVKAPPARYEVTFLHPDRTAEMQVIDSAGDRLRVHFPNGDWAVSGLVIRGPQSTSPAPALPQRRVLARPDFLHKPPASAVAGKPLELVLHVRGANPAAIRLHYRALNQQESFHTIEGGPSFTIPADQISARFDLLYYFEVLNAERTGWFYPDPATSTPYFVVETKSK